MLKKLKGWKTHIIATAIMIIPALVTFFAGVDWQAFGIKPEVSAMIGLVFNVLRIISTTPSPMSRRSEE